MVIFYTSPSDHQLGGLLIIRNMPIGIYKHPPQCGFQKGHKFGKRFKKGNIPWTSNQKGIHLSLATEFKKGMTPWNKGKKETRNEVLRKLSDCHIGHTHTKETCEKMSERLKKDWNIGKMKGMIGKKVSLKTRSKISEALKGEKNHNWKGGENSENHRIRGGLKNRLWRESVFTRDNWTCQKCKIKGGKLHPHHIKNFAQYPELRFVIDNGITLCKKCHQKFHKIYGTKNNNQEQLKEFQTV